MYHLSSYLIATIADDNAVLPFIVERTGHVLMVRDDCFIPDKARCSLREYIEALNFVVQLFSMLSVVAPECNHVVRRRHRRKEFYIRERCFILVRITGLICFLH